MKPNLILSPQLLPAICKFSGSSYDTKSMAQPTQCTLAFTINRAVFVIQTSEGDTKSGECKGLKSPSGVQRQSAKPRQEVWGTKSPEAQTFR